MGLNKYNTDIYKLVLKYWERCSRLDYKGAKTKLEQEGVVFKNVKTTDEQISDACERDGLSVNVTQLDDVGQLMEKLNAVDDLNVSIEDITSFCNKQLGIQLEKSAIQKYEERINVVVDDKDDYVKKAFKEDGEFMWCVGGRMDGVSRKNDKYIIIEIKNRKTHIYPRVPIYEIVQVYTYMYITDINQASLVEICGDEIEETNFNYSFGYEMYVLTGLNKLCTLME